MEFFDEMKVLLSNTQQTGKIRCCVMVSLDSTVRK